MTFQKSYKFDKELSHWVAVLVSLELFDLLNVVDKVFGLVENGKVFGRN
jgi:hypothetical protein